MDRSPHRTHPLITVLKVVLVAVGIGFIGLITWTISYVLMATTCPGYDDEGTIAAPKSLQGRVMCGDNGPAGQNWILAVMALLVVLALAVWLIRRATAGAVLLLVVAAIIPIPMAIVMQSLPATCSSAQWDTYGEAGCQTDLEQRGGLDQGTDE